MSLQTSGKRRRNIIGLVVRVNDIKDVPGGASVVDNSGTGR